MAADELVERQLDLGDAHAHPATSRLGDRWRLDRVDRVAGIGQERRRPIDKTRHPSSSGYPCGLVVTATRIGAGSGGPSKGAGDHQGPADTAAAITRVASRTSGTVRARMPWHDISPASSPRSVAEVGLKAAGGPGWA